MHMLGPKKFDGLLMAQTLINIESRALRNNCAVLWTLFVGTFVASGGYALWRMTGSDFAVLFGAASVGYVLTAYFDLCVFIFKL